MITRCAHLGFSNDLDGDGLALVVALLDDGGAGVAEVAPSHLLPQLVLGPEVLPEAEGLVQRALRRLGHAGCFLRYGAVLVLRLPSAEPLGERGLYVLSGRRRREGPLEEPPGRGPRRRRGRPGRQRAGSAGGVGAGPGDAGRLVRRRGRSGLAAPRRRGRRPRRSAVGRQRGGQRDDPDVVVVGPRRRAACLPVALAHRAPRLGGEGCAGRVWVWGVGAPAIARGRPRWEWDGRREKGGRGGGWTDGYGPSWRSLFLSPHLPVALRCAVTEEGRREKEEATVNSPVPRGVNRKNGSPLRVVRAFSFLPPPKTKRPLSSRAA
jgi:hypothetical protein